MTHTFLIAVNKFQLRLKLSHRNILQICRLSPSNREIHPFWFISSCLPMSVNNLPVFENFSDAPRQNSSSQIFRNTPPSFVFCDCLFKKFPLKEAFYLTQNTVEYRKYSDGQATRQQQFFSCCFTLNKKIEWTQSITCDHNYGKELSVLYAVKLM